MPKRIRPLLTFKPFGDDAVDVMGKCELQHSRGNSK